MPLTDVACRAAKKAEKPYKLSDAGGLYLLVDTTGSRLWRQAYRMGGKQKLLSLGKYPDVSLADARIARDANKALLTKGVDPSEQRKADKRIAGAAHLRAIDGYDGNTETRLALQLLALTALRPGELRQLRWSWVADDAKKPAITLPPEVMKMRREHMVPLSRQAIAILAQLREMTGWSTMHAEAGADYVFPNAQPRRVVGKDGKPSKRPALRPMSEGALGSALRRLGYSSDRHVPHGFRSSFSTLANSSRLFDADIIEAALAHSDGNQIRSIYNRATYDADRARLAQWWADHVDDMRKSGNVVAIAKARRSKAATAS